MNYSASNSISPGAIVLTDFLRAALEGSNSIYSQRLVECKKDFSEKAVHDFRVSIRRFLSLIKMIGEIFDSPYIPELTKDLKSQLSMFGPLRDAQVQALTAMEARLEFPELYPFLCHLLMKEMSFIKRLRKKIDALSEADIEGPVFFLKLDMKNKIHITEKGPDVLLNIIGRRFDKIDLHIKKADPKKPATIHKVRLRFKTFRYMIEHTRGLSGIDDAFIAEMKAFQTIMGSVQDIEAMKKALNSFIRSRGKKHAGAYQSAIQRFNDRKKALIEEFMRTNGAALTFYERVRDGWK